MIAITVEDIRKIYRGSRSEPVHAVDGISFEISQGQIYPRLQQKRHESCGLERSKSDRLLGDLIRLRGEDA